MPSSVRITEFPAPCSIGDGTGFNLRTYFSPALHPGHFFTDAQMSALLGARPAPLLSGLAIDRPKKYLNRFGLTWVACVGKAD